MPQTIAVKLGAEIVTVTGVVNGTPTTFEKYQGTVWRTTVERSETGAYVIEITGWDELGRASVYTTTLQYGFAAVTTRGPGTYYNVSDLNRVGHAVEYLADLLMEYGYGVPVSPRIDWTMVDFPTAGEMERYLGNVRALMDAYCLMPTTPPLPECMEKLGYKGANAIEQILVDMHILILNMAAAWYYSGEIYAGEA